MYEAEILTSSKKYNVPVEVIQAVIQIESAWNIMAFRNEPDYRQSDGTLGDASRGLMQILHDTAKWLGFSGRPTELFNPTINIDLGTKYLAYQFGRYKNWYDAVAAYNAGSARKNEFGEYVNSRGETNVQDHVNKFIAVWDEIKKKIIPTLSFQIKAPAYRGIADLAQFYQPPSQYQPNYSLQMTPLRTFLTPQTNKQKKILSILVITLSIATIIMILD